MGKLFMGVRRRSAASTDGRLKLIDTIIAEISVIKSNTWESLFLDPVRSIRK